jgi:hypothetical protein
MVCRQFFNPCGRRREMRQMVQLGVLIVLSVSFFGCIGDMPVVGDNESSDNMALEESTGIYGTIMFDYQCCPEDYYLVDGVFVYIYIGGNYHGYTTASACGYYTYDTNGDHGSVEVLVESQYRPIRPTSCTSISFYDTAAGNAYGNLSEGYWVKIDVHTL